jgi:acetyl esterase/lipase
LPAGRGYDTVSVTRPAAPRRHPETAMTTRRSLPTTLVLALALAALAGGQTQDKSTDKPAPPKAKAKAGPPKPPVPPTAANLAYGPHPRNVLDFFRAKAEAPTPLVFCIHGGGWRAGDKSSYYGSVKSFLDNGLSVVTINYRLIGQPGDPNAETPPVKAPLEDAKRALQFVRSKAAEWNVDPKRIGATGGSAGACSSLWLALHDDMADPASPDPIARQSTRLFCAAVNGAQVSLDPKETRSWLPNYTYGAHAFGLKSLDEVEAQRDRLAAWIKEYSPITHVSKDDPPIGLYYTGTKGAKVGEVHPDPTHSPILGLKLAEALRAAGVDVVYHSNTEPNEKLPTSSKYLIDRLKR